MKKVISSLALLICTVHSYAAQLYIENETNSKFSIQVLRLDHEYLSNIQFFDYNGNATLDTQANDFTIISTSPFDYQFPLPNIYPFIGNVYQNGNVINLPLPQLDMQNANDAYFLTHVKFRIEGGGDNGFQIINGVGSVTSNFYDLNYGNQYTVSYVDMGSIKYFNVAL